MCLLHQSQIYGVLTAEMEQKLPQLLGKDRRTLLRLMAEVQQKSLLIRDGASGLLTSKRMVKDEYIRQVRAKAGKEGAKFGHLGGLPKISRGQNERQNNPPSSSSSYITPLTPQGGNGGQVNESSETRKMLVKWLKTMPDVKRPNSMADYYLREWGESIVRRALKNSNCVSRQKLRELCEHYKASVASPNGLNSGDKSKNDIGEPLKITNKAIDP